MSNIEKSKVSDSDFQLPNFLDCLFIVVKHKKKILLASLGAAILAAVVTLFIPNSYTARAMIVPSEDDTRMMGSLMAQMGGVAGMAVPGGSSNADLYVTMLNSETVKDPIIDRFKLMDRYKAALRQDAYQALDKNSDFSIGKKDGVLTISFDDEDPKVAAAIANAYVEELGKLAADISMSGADKNKKFLEDQLSTAKTSLARAEEAMTAFQIKNKAVSVPDQARESIVEVSQLRAQLAAYEVQLGTLKHQFTDNSHEVKTAKAAIANIRSQIASLEGVGGHGSVPSVGNLPQLGQEYLRALRELKLQETLVELLTKQYEMTKLTAVKDVVPFSIIQQAKVPEMKSAPRRGAVVISTTLAVCLLMVIAVVAAESTRRMRNEESGRWQEFIALLSFKNR